MAFIKVKVSLGDVVGSVAPVPSIIIKVAQGKTLDEAIHETTQDPVEAAGDAAEVLADIEAEIKDSVDSLAEKVGGEDGRKIAEDFLRIMQPINVGHVEQGLAGLDKFIETGDIEYLNPVIVLLAQEIQGARDKYWDSAEPVLEDVIKVVPEEVRPFAMKTRVILASKVQTLSLPYFAITHLKKATALAAIDLVFFESIPSIDSDQDKYLWAHELYHVKQYSELGLQEFVKQYVREEMNLHRGNINSLERNADVFACKAFPEAYPSYIASCADAT